MRRSLQALLTVALLALVCAGAAPAGAADHSVARATIVCPGGPPPPCCVPVVAKPQGIPCCLGASAQPSIIPPCCVPPAIVPCPGITIASSPDPSAARQSVDITGRLMTTASAGVTVTLWQELPGEKSFHSVAQASADSTGSYQFVRPAGRVRTNRTWYVTASGMRSLSLAQMVRARISLSISAQKAGTGERVMFTGRVSPSHAGEWIALQERTAARWIQVASVRLTAGSSFSVSKLFAGSSSALVRAALGADSRNIASYSPAIRTTI